MGPSKLRINDGLMQTTNQIPHALCGREAGTGFSRSFLEATQSILGLTDVGAIEQAPVGYSGRSRDTSPADVVTA